MTTTAPVAGWYPDPLGSTDHRYWDGSGWTERTAPAAAPEPVTAPQVPIQPTATQPLPEQALPFQAMAPQAAPAWPGAPVNGTPQPYGYQPGGMPPQPYLYRPGAQPGQVRPGFAYQRPPGRSTAATVLIAVAVAFGVLFVVGILAAIAIPVFLNQRAAAGTTTVTIPESAAGLTLSHSASSQQLIQQLTSLQVPGQKSAGVYDDVTGRPKAMIWVSQYHFSAAERAVFFKEAESQVTGNGISAFHRTAPGPLGGEIRCAAGSRGNATATICMFVDAQVGGVVDVAGTTNGDALAVQLREAIEHRS